MQTNTLFGIAAIIASIGYVLHALPFAHAYPQSPNVSFGANPIQSFYNGNCNASPNVFTNAEQQDFVITDIVNDYDVGYVVLQRNGSVVFKGYGGNSFESGIRISPGDVVTCTHYYGGRGLTISGYYTQS